MLYLHIRLNAAARCNLDPEATEILNLVAPGAG